MSRRWLDSLFDLPTVAPTISRRELLQSGLATAAGLLLSGSECQAMQQRGRGRRVIVVGAGFAGLACAFELIGTGCEVVVLEARDRIGGRVHSMSDLVPGKFAEAGGEFLGANHPTVISYAARFKFELLDIPAYSENTTGGKVLNGRRLITDELKSTRPQVDRALDQLTSAAAAVVPDRPWLTKDAAALDAMSTGNWIKNLEMTHLAKELIAAQLTSTNGVPVELQSQLGNLAQIRGGGLERYWTETERYRCRGGNEMFAKKLAEGINRDRILLRAPVSTIATEDKQVRVTTATGDEFIADDVVLCTPPPTWTKIKFSPALPASLQPQMGQSLKFLTAVRNRFWQKREMEPSSFSYSGSGLTSLGTANQKPSDPREVLISFISGPLAEKWSNYPSKTRLADYQADVESLLPGFRESIEKTVFVNWVGMSLTGGGYSFPAPGQVTQQGPIMHEGLKRLHFAGEHTCYQFVGYMEGALRSGVDAAKRVLKLGRI